MSKYADLFIFKWLSYVPGTKNQNQKHWTIVTYNISKESSFIKVLPDTLLRKNLILLCFFIIYSCGFNEPQKNIIQNIEHHNGNIYSSDFQKDVLRYFSNKDIIELSSDSNPYIAIYFFKLLVKKFPEDCYEVFVKNFNNKNTLEISTSYDTVETMTVSQAMLFYCIFDNNIFSESQQLEIFDRIVKNLNRNRDLELYYIYFLDKYSNSPNPRYYSIIKNDLQYQTKKYFFIPGLIKYFSNYNKEEDEILIKNYITNYLYKSPLYPNPALEFIEEKPKPEFFSLLCNLYYNKIKEDTIYIYSNYFDLEYFIKALIKYENTKAKEILNEIIQSKNLNIQGDVNFQNEEIYKLLVKDNKKGFFDNEIQLLLKITKKEYKNKL